MTSTTIYTPISPTYLYIKQHSITKKKYFGKTTLDDPIKYLGSGPYWKKHINKHGKQFVETIWVSEPYTDTSIIEHALHFSAENNIAESNEWANLIHENGLDGWVPGITRSTETKAKMSASKTGITRSTETKAKISATNTGKKKGPLSAETKAKISVSSTGKKKKPQSAETKANLSASRTGKKRGPYKKKQKLPHPFIHSFWK